MKLGKSKLALAKVINENGGWPERALWAVQDNCIAFFRGGKPEYKSGDRCWYSNCLDGACVGTITRYEKVTNWHQTILSREEYYQAYPKADADGWIEHDGKHEPAVATSGLTLWCRWSDGLEQSHEANMVDWIDDSDVRIIAYRLHKPEIATSAREPKPVPVPEAKPTIEQLAADYRNAKGYADRKQDEADKASMESDAALSQLEDAIAAIGFAITPLAATEKEPELVITDWRDLRVGDEIEMLGDGWNCDNVGKIGVVRIVEDDGYFGDLAILCDIGEEGSDCGLGFKFIRRP